eukprot:1254844-Alexandrium_andersonii.AAC.1
MHPKRVALPKSLRPSGVSLTLLLMPPPMVPRLPSVVTSMLVPLGTLRSELVRSRPWHSIPTGLTWGRG